MISSQDVLNAAYDAEFESLKSFDGYHHLIHEGEVFEVSHKFAAIPAGQKRHIIITPSTHPMHVVFALQSTGTAEVALYKGITKTGAGTALTPVNANGESAATAHGAFAHTVTSIDAYGTRQTLRGMYGSSGGSVKIGGELRPGSERILRATAPVPLYALEVENTGAGAIDITIQIEFYEKAAS